jgi:hypothetical protein
MPAMSDTPETDALTSVGLENADRECVPADFARKLERERDEARELLANALVRGDLALSETKKAKEELFWSDYQDKREMQRERDEAREQNAKLRDIAEMAIKAISSSEYGEFSYTSAVLRAELDQLKEGAK